MKYKKEVVFVLNKKIIFQNYIFIEKEGDKVEILHKDEVPSSVLYFTNDTRYINIHREFYKKLKNWGVVSDPEIAEILNFEHTFNFIGSFRTFLFAKVQSHSILDIDDIVNTCIEILTRRVISSIVCKNNSCIYAEKQLNLVIANVITSFDEKIIEVSIYNDTSDVKNFRFKNSVEQVLYKLLQKDEISTIPSPEYKIKFIDIHGILHKEYGLNLERMIKGGKL